MNPLQDSKFVNVIRPAAIVDAADFTTQTIDTAGARYATIIFNLGASDIAMGALKVQESDDSGMSGAVDITGTRIGTDADAYGTTSVLPTAGNDNLVVVFDIDLRGRKRYLDLVATAGDGSAGTFASAVCVLSRLEVSANDETSSNTLWRMRV